MGPEAEPGKVGADLCASHKAAEEPEEEQPGLDVPGAEGAQKNPLCPLLHCPPGPGLKKQAQRQSLCGRSRRLPACAMSDKGT